MSILALSGGGGGVQPKFDSIFSEIKTSIIISLEYEKKNRHQLISVSVKSCNGSHRYNENPFGTVHVVPAVRLYIRRVIMLYFYQFELNDPTYIHTHTHYYIIFSDSILLCPAD